MKKIYKLITVFVCVLLLTSCSKHYVDGYGGFIHLSTVGYQDNITGKEDFNELFSECNQNSYLEWNIDYLANDTDDHKITFHFYDDELINNEKIIFAFDTIPFSLKDNDVLEGYVEFDYVYKDKEINKMRLKHVKDNLNLSTDYRKFTFSYDFAQYKHKIIYVNIFMTVNLDDIDANGLHCIDFTY